MSQVVVRWTGSGIAFGAHMPGGHALVMDEPKPQGDNEGASPTDMLLAALASCSGISCIALARKMRQPVDYLEVTATGTQQEDWPKAFTKIHLTFTITSSSSSDPSRIEEAIHRAVTRYCPVSATLQLGEGGCMVTHEIRMSQTAAE